VRLFAQHLASDTQPALAAREYLNVRQMEKPPNIAAISFVKLKPKVERVAVNKFMKKCFSLIELLIYIALISVFMTGMISFALRSSKTRAKVENIQLVEQNLKSAHQRIAYEIARAKNVQNISTSQLVLDNGGSPTTINFSSQKIFITSGGLGPDALTSNQVAVTTLNFADLTSTDNNAKNIKVDITIEMAGYSQSMNQSTELNSQFNEARALIADGTAVTLANGDKDINEVTLQNSGSSTITIDKITVSWVGGTAGAHFTLIKINGANVWTGSASSGQTVDITNVAISSGAAAIPFDSLLFDSKMTNSIINVFFVMSDKSIAQIELSFGVQPTATPTTAVTPTPTPVNCNQYCVYKYGTSGSCLKNNDCPDPPKHNEGRIYECTSPNYCCCN
jgi:type II secretory pathway pseudopilin PulG